MHIPRTVQEIHDFEKHARDVAEGHQDKLYFVTVTGNTEATFTGAAGTEDTMQVRCCVLGPGRAGGREQTCH